MPKNTPESIVIAQRLKALREERKLSHEKLSEELKERYGLEISKSSLMNYEVSADPHSKAGKNLGMSINYLRCFADFYNVSADYLIGLSNIKSPNSSIQAIVESTGLTEANAVFLNNLIAGADDSQWLKWNMMVCAMVNDLLSFCQDDLVVTDYKLLQNAVERSSLNAKSIDASNLPSNRSVARYVEYYGSVLLPSKSAAEYFAKQLGYGIGQLLVEKYVKPIPTHSNFIERRRSKHGDN